MPVITTNRPGQKHEHIICLPYAALAADCKKPHSLKSSVGHCELRY